VRAATLLLLFVGLVALGGGIFLGCGSLFAWNGRHPIAVAPLTIDTPSQRTFPVRADRRYTLAVTVVFEREGLEEKNGALLVDAKLPLKASIEGSTGQPQKVDGWLDPNEPPTTLFGHRTDPEAQRHPRGTDPPELAAQRMVGPFRPSADGEATFAVHLGRDRIGRATIREVRAVVYDDQMPASVKLPFAAAGIGAVFTAFGTGLLVVGAARRKRGGKRPRKNV
jgi:hypothetical protein